MLEVCIIGVGHPLCHSRGEKSICIQGEDNKKRGGSRQGPAANTWGDHDTGSKSQSGGNLVNDGKGKECIDMWSVDKNKGDNYVVISLRLVTSHVVPYVMAPTNLAFKELLKIIK